MAPSLYAGIGVPCGFHSRAVLWSVEAAAGRFGFGELDSIEPLDLTILLEHVLLSVPETVRWHAP